MERKLEGAVAAASPYMSDLFAFRLVTSWMRYHVNNGTNISQYTYMHREMISMIQELDAATWCHYREQHATKAVGRVRYSKIVISIRIADTQGSMDTTVLIFQGSGREVG